MKPKPIWKPNQGAQYRAWSALEVDELFFGGGRGSGKTSWGLGNYSTQLAMYGKSAKGLILRQSFPECEEIITQAQEMFEDTGLARFNAQKRIFYFKGRLKGATLEIGYLKKVKDYSRYHGRPFSYILFDEITEFASWDLVERMGSCLRSKDKKVKCIMRFTGNPGGRLHSIVKKEFYDPAPCGDTVFVTKKGKRRMMIHSTVKDNPFLWNNGEGDYAKWLTSLPDVLRMAWFEGKWDIALGGIGP